MSLALLAAFAASLALHAAALFIPDVDLSTAPEPPPLHAEIRLPPPAPEKPAPLPKVPAVKPARAKSPVPAVRPNPSPAVEAAPVAQLPAAVVAAEPAAPPPPAKVAEAQLPTRGGIRFVVFRGDQELEVGHATHDWEFDPDGSYRLRVVTETTGLAALFKPVRIELESRGRFVEGGLRPDRFTTLRNGAPTTENADFDWEARKVTIQREGKSYDLADGAQDLVSFHYQLVFVPQLADGATIGVANGRKFERYRFESLGEEKLETRAGTFRTLHVRVKTDSTTELWLALDRQLLPVKIRHTDRKGESFEQVAVDLGKP